ncbi:MAG TPA: hypothetical protein VKA68_03300 [bacterium]|nr:hypothetical protein [bacterium]
MERLYIILGLIITFGAQLVFGQVQPPEIGGIPEEQGFSMSGGIGAVGISGQLYNSITLRPELSAGKFGIGLDLPLYFNANGELRTEEWNDPGDILDKIYYIRYGLPDDSLYVRAGALSSVTLGYGLIVRDYTNTIDYPSIRRVGGRFRIMKGPIGLEGFVANFKELNGPGLVGGRLTYSGLGPLVIGATVASDVNPYLGLPDEDNDGYPDRVDDFPRDKEAAVDSDGDGIPDGTDLDRDGDGWADNPDASTRLGVIEGALPFELDPDGAQVKSEPFNVKNADAPSITEVGLDIGMPIPFLTTEYTQLFLYAQSAMMLNEQSAVAAVDTNGWGIGAPGISFDTRFPFNVGMNIGFEYRVFSKYFVGEFFDRAYDIERVSYRRIPESDSLQVITKAGKLLPNITGRLKGYYGSLSFNFFNWITLRSVYQDYKGRVRDRSFYADAQLNTQIIPKISSAYAYYRKSHIRGDNLFSVKDESTIWGYRIGYQVGENVQLLLGYRETYLDRNGNGAIDNGNETIRTTSVETAFNF